MSVRNYSVKNYTKIAPFPPSSKPFTEDRIASNRIYDLRTNIYKGKPKGVREHYDTSDIENELPKKANYFANNGGLTNRGNKTKDKPKQIGKLSNNVNNYADDYLKNNKAKIDTMMTRETKIKTRKVGADTSPTNLNKSGRHGPVRNPTSGRTDEQIQRPSQSTLANADHEGGVDRTSQRSLRPKSARPESRWGRRTEPDDTEILYDSTVKPSRPKSARPTSRMIRMIETQSDTDYDFINDLPERPKTSHARRPSMADDDSVSGSYTTPINSSRPKSRLGRDPDVLKLYYSDTDSLADSLTDSSDSSLDRTSDRERETSKRGNTKGNTTQRDKTSDVGGYTGTYNAGQSPGMFARGSTMFDLKSGIDDIDLDVDPVEYFMQDGNPSIRGGTNKPQLSKDTINYIGKTRKPHQDKVVKGYHGYNQNKHHPTAEISDRYHGNGFQNQQYSISERNQRCVNQEMLGKINQKGDKVRNYSLANGDAYQSRRTSRNALRYSKPEVSRDVLAKYTTLGSISKKGNTPLQGGDYRRKPRKLDPIFPSNMKPF